MTLLTVLLVLGATARLTLLLTADVFPPVVWLRTRVNRWADRRQHGVDEHWAAVLITCPWCVSFWIGLAVSAVGWFAGDEAWFVILAVALTASLASGFAGQARA